MLAIPRGPRELAPHSTTGVSLGPGGLLTQADLLSISANTFRLGAVTPTSGPPPVATAAAPG